MPRKILLIDDNHDALDLLEMFLFNEYEIVTAMNGFDGLKIAENEIPDLIITDIMMPIMDGIRFFNNLRRKKETASIPVIAITSFAKKITRKSLLNMGFTGVMSKPLEKDSVTDLVEKILNRVAKTEQ